VADIILDNLNGVASTLISAHTPDVAPSGWTWSYSFGAAECILDGAGGLYCPADGNSTSELGGGAPVALPAEFTVRLTGDAGNNDVDNDRQFQCTLVGDGGDYSLFMDIRRNLESAGCEIRIGRAGEVRSFYPSLSTAVTIIDLIAEHHSDGTATVTLNGTDLGEPSGGWWTTPLPEEATALQLMCASNDPGGGLVYAVAHSVSVSTPDAPGGSTIPQIVHHLQQQGIL
jgi:hypothetical protein